MEAEDRIVQLLEQQLAWTRAAALPAVRSVILASLKSEKERAAFEASDGRRSTREVARIAGVRSHNTVAVWWRKWRALGVAAEAPGGKASHLVSLGDLGIPIKPDADQAQTGGQ